MPTLPGSTGRADCQRATAPMASETASKTSVWVKVMVMGLPNPCGAETIAIRFMLGTGTK